MAGTGKKKKRLGCKAARMTYQIAGRVIGKTVLIFR